VPKLFEYEVKDEFFELVCGGVPFVVAEQVIGVARGTGAVWWQRCGLVDVMPQLGAIGGLPGTASAGVPGAGGPDEPPRRRRPLTSEDRAVIAAGLRRELGFTEIAALIGRDRSVVWREVARHRGPDGSYWAPVAHRAAHEHRRRPKAFRLRENPALCRRIEAWMDQGWSPKLIARVLKADHPHMIMDRVSHETIYQALYVQTRGQLRRDLHRQLSLKRARRRPQEATQRPCSRYREAFKISQRPAEVADRAVPGHWEGDLILGAGNTSAVGTLVERQTRFTMLLHLPGRHDADSVAEAMLREMGKLPDHLRRSLTWDRGVELMGYRRLQVELNMPVYFCDPRSPWQRGTNENTNRLLRHWLEKGTDLSTHTAEDLHRIATSLNQRPRPTLNMQTPAQALAALLAGPAAA
jgi:transposase, IS30 family